MCICIVVHLRQPIRNLPKCAQYSCVHMTTAALPSTSVSLARSSSNLALSCSASPRRHSSVSVEAGCDCCCGCGRAAVADDMPAGCSPSTSVAAILSAEGIHGENSAPRRIKNKQTNNDKSNLQLITNCFDTAVHEHQRTVVNCGVTH